MSQTINEHDLLFGVLAARSNNVDGEQFVFALKEWLSDRGCPLDRYLAEREVVPAEDYQVIKHELERQLSQCFDITTPPPGNGASIDPLSTAPHEGPSPSGGSDSEQLDTALFGQLKDDESVLTVGPGGDRFEMIRSHAHGGLGEVFLALDKQLNRQVALKVLRPRHADKPQQQQRFILEGEITGGLEHPGIVPIYSMGRDELARPFYAMRFIRGGSLRAAIAEFHEQQKAHPDIGRNSLELRRLLGRFIDVCNAIEYAHTRGVLHRDLKPDNVMVGRFGETLVVDWGLARVARSEDPDATVDVDSHLRPSALSGTADTLEGSAVGTPAYMSPEQAEGKHSELGPTSDVYGLGAILYSILTGKSPVSGKDLNDILDKVIRGDFPSARQTNPHVPAALDAICRKAMAVKPEDRYQSAAALADEVERWLGDEAVSAHQETWVERSGRWLRRHRSWALAGGSSLLLVAVVAMVSTIVVNRARVVAKNLAVANAELAEQEKVAKNEAVRRFEESRDTVDTWLTGFSEALQHYPGTQAVRSRMLERAAEDYERFAAEKSRDPNIELERGRTLLRLGDVRHNLNDTEQAIVAYDEARHVFADLLNTDFENPAIAIESASSLDRKALALAKLGKYDEALQANSQAVEELKKLSESTAERRKERAALARALVNRGNLLESSDEIQEAQTCLSRANDELQRLVAEVPGELEYQQALATTRLALGNILYRRGSVSVATQLFRDAVRIFDGIARLDPETPTYLHYCAVANSNLAMALQVRGDREGQLSTYEQAEIDYVRLCEAQPDVPTFREQLAVTRNNLGQLLLELVRLGDARKHLISARDEFLRLAQSYPQVLDYAESYAVAVDNLGQLTAATAAYDEALALSEDAERIYQRLATTRPEEGAYTERLAISLSHQAQVLHEQRHTELAATRFQSALERIQALTEKEPNVASYQKTAARIQDRLGYTLWDGQKTSEARDAWQLTAEYWDQLLANSPEPEHQAEAAWFFAICPVQEIRRPEEAVELARTAVDAAPLNPKFHSVLAASYYSANRYDNADRACRKAVELRGEPHAMELFLRAVIQEKLGDSADARKIWQQGADWLASKLPGHWELGRLKALTGKILEIEPAVESESSE